MTLSPDLERLLMETSWSVLKDLGLDQTPIEQMTREQIDMIAERIGFELKAKLTEFFGGVNPEWLKDQFKVVRLRSKVIAVSSYFFFQFSSDNMSSLYWPQNFNSVVSQHCSSKTFAQPARNQKEFSVFT